jgi:hypothetical protein
MTTMLGTQDQETGEVTGTPDTGHNLVSFLQQCLSNVLRLEIYAKDAERTGESRKGAEQSKRLLYERLAA